MSALTAEVQALTAEVRVLMVGNRQVTLSVYRQLDRVEAAECEPFGRVNDDKDKDYGSRVWVVGRNRQTGDLVRSHQDWNGWFSAPEVKRLPYWREFCSLRPSDQWKQRGELEAVTLFEDGDLRVSATVIAPRHYYGPAGTTEGDWEITPSGLSFDEMKIGIETALVPAVTRAKAVFDRYYEWQKLPLIILAGLR